MPTAVVLLSGGLDSTVSLALARKYYRLDRALFFDYGQRAAGPEREAAAALAGHYGISLETVSLPWLGELSSSALIRGGADIPDFSGREEPEEIGAASRAVWMENRNGIFLNIAAAYAAERGCEIIISGFNREEAATFPDNSKSFLEAVNRALAIGCLSPVRVESPTLELSKAEIVNRGRELDIPWELIWSCYRGEELMCGRCESCVRLRRAVASTPVARRLNFAQE
ncbi:MAG: 7-cyano-7-deazaguanine synthase QueC [Candidatus Krumholzibacteriota bacterium]|nr:7-cyano-7-deazaguanine synthase QueC [Candidatus Krumholzibacteriota bacterium]